jgi:hypothetical protein
MRWREGAGSTGGAPTFDLCEHVRESPIQWGGEGYLFSFIEYFSPYK